MPTQYNGNGQDGYQFDFGQALSKTQVTIGNNGIFKTELNLDEYSSSDYTIVLAESNQTITSKDITVDNYVKPLYKMDVQNGINVYFDYENANVSANVSFYDGTPAVNLPFEASMTYYSDTPNKTITKQTSTDKSGHLQTEISLLQTQNNNIAVGWEPQNEYITLTCQSADDSTLTQDTTVSVLPRTTMLVGQVNQKDDKPTITISTNLITKNNLTVDNVNSDNLDQLLCGNSVDIPVTVKILKYTDVKTKTGSYYDYIQKKSFDSYTYNYVTSTVSEQVVNTSGGKYELDNLPVSTDNGFYYTCDLRTLYSIWFG